MRENLVTSAHFLHLAGWGLTIAVSTMWGCRSLSARRSFSSLSSVHAPATISPMTDKDGVWSDERGGCGAYVFQRHDCVLQVLGRDTREASVVITAAVSKGSELASSQHSGLRPDMFVENHLAIFVHKRSSCKS